MLNKNPKSQFIFAFVLSLFPFMVFSASLSDVLKCQNDPCKLIDVLSVIEGLNSYIALKLIPIVATMAFLYAGLIMVIGAGNPGEVSKAKNIMWYALYGMMFGFAAYYIVDLIVRGLAGGSPDEIVKQYLKN